MAQLCLVIQIIRRGGNRHCMYRTLSVIFYQIIFWLSELVVYLTVGSFSFLNIHHHSLKPKAFPNQDRGRGGREGTEGGSGAQKKKCGDIQSNARLVLRIHRGEKKMRDMYKHRNKQSARLAVPKANNKIKTCRENWMVAKTGR